MSKYTPRVLTFVSVDRDRVNRDLDQELVDRERAQALVNMADKILDELDLDRLISGDIEP